VGDVVGDVEVGTTLVAFCVDSIDSDCTVLTLVIVSGVVGAWVGLVVTGVSDSVDRVFGDCVGSFVTGAAVGDCVWFEVAGAWVGDNGNVLEEAVGLRETGAWLGNCVGFEVNEAVFGNCVG